MRLAPHMHEVSCASFTLNTACTIVLNFTDSCMTPGDNIMDHFLKLDYLYTRLASISDKVMIDKKLLIRLGSLSPEYDAVVRIITATRV